MTATDPRTWTPEFFLSNQSECRCALNDSKKRMSVPSLNSLPLHNFRDKQLVRFRGMIQDMYNPEFYLDSFKIRNVKTNEIKTCSGKYRDTVDSVQDDTVVVDSKENVNAERQACFVISVPCLNNWAKETQECSMEISCQESLNSAAKRPLEESEEMECEDLGKKKPLPNTSSNGDAEQRSSSIFSREHVMNFPLPNEDGKACIVKIYDEISYKLNQVVDILGFISLDPSLSCGHDSDQLMDEVEFQSHNPPASLIPRLHAVEVRDTSKEEIASLLSSGDFSNFQQNTRDDLKLVLSQLLFGDTLAAEYLICHLISSIYLRRDLLSLGTFPLNITNFSLDNCKTFPEEFYAILSSILPKTHLLSITLDELNNLNLLPKKDYDCNRLTSGVLQLSDNTHLILDETKLTSGKVSPNGKKNYEAFASLISDQKVTYDFKYYTMEFQTDIPVIILSEVKSMIPCERRIALEKSPDIENLYSETLEAAKQYMKNETRIRNIRNYLMVSRHRKIEIDDKIGEVIEDDFVEMLKTEKGTTADDMHSLMVLARLLSVSHGSVKLTIDHWKEAVKMEKERKRRLQRKAPTEK